MYQVENHMVIDSPDAPWNAIPPTELEEAEKELEELDEEIQALEEEKEEERKELEDTQQRIDALNVKRDDAAWRVDRAYQRGMRGAVCLYP